MYKCEKCDKEQQAILILSCKHQMCLQCLIKLTKSECPCCNISLLNEIPKKINSIIESNTPMGCPYNYHSKDIECDDSCFL